MITALLSLVLAALAVPPLTDAQRTQLDTALDRSPVLDEGALYPLLQNALLWEPGDEAGAAVPDYDALLDHPADARGDLFLIEGPLARKPRQFGLSRPGPWGQAVTEWVVLVRQDPDEVAVVYLVDPDGVLPTPRVGRQVRIAARFYKLWGDRDETGEPATFLTFVGRGATVVGGRAAGAEGGGAFGWRIVVLAPIVVLVLASYVLLRLLLRRRGPQLDRRRRLTETREREVAEELHDLPPSDLPKDPAEAMEALSRRQDDAGDQ